MEASLPKNPAVAPGEKSPLVVTFTEPGGVTLVTSGAGKGKVSWSDLAITATVVSVSKKGVVSLPRDPRVSDGKMGRVVITIPSQPGITTDLDIPLRYDYPFVSKYSGSAGSNGLSGNDGANGTSGSIGSFDPDHPSAGGDGTNGTNGTDGQDGSGGGDGPPVEVRLAFRTGARPLLQIGVTAKVHNERFYLVDPQGGSLTIQSTGGAGGLAGKGGAAARGGSGGAGMPNGRDGSNGLAGYDGHPGSPGRDGTITVIYDPQTQPYLSIIVIPTHDGPRPVFIEQPVAPLW
jgi:hypothetical protein